MLVVRRHGATHLWSRPEMQGRLRRPLHWAWKEPTRRKYFAFGGGCLLKSEIRCCLLFFLLSLGVRLVYLYMGHLAAK